jgi:translation elongation factor EF-1beta
MTNQDSALDLKIGPKDKDADKKKQKKKLTREDKELS